MIHLFPNPIFTFFSFVLPSLYPCFLIPFTLLISTPGITSFTPVARIVTGNDQGWKAQSYRSPRRWSMTTLHWIYRRKTQYPRSGTWNCWEWNWLSQSAVAHWLQLWWQGRLLWGGGRFLMKGSLLLIFAQHIPSFEKLPTWVCLL